MTLFTLDIEGGTLALRLVEPWKLAGVLAGAAAGAALQVWADPGAPRGAWRGALPWWAGIAASFSITVAWGTARHSGDVDLVWTTAQAILLAAGAVALLQVAAAAAGRGHPAPLAGAARWARAATLAVAFVWLTPLTHFPREVSAALGAALIAVAAVTRALRRAPLPGSALVLGGAVAGLGISQTVHSLADPRALALRDPLVLAGVHAPDVLVPLAAWLCRRLDRRALVALGIDAGAPGEVYAAFVAAQWVVAILVENLIERGLSVTGGTLFDSPRLYWGMRAACSILATLAVGALLGYLRRRVDAAAARRREAA